MAFEIAVKRDERSLEEYAEPVAGHYLEARDGDHLYFSEPITKDLAEQLTVAARKAQKVIQANIDSMPETSRPFFTTLLILSPMLLPGGGL